jgi:hypothetical protein
LWLAVGRNPYLSWEVFPPLCNAIIQRLVRNSASYQLSFLKFFGFFDEGQMMKTAQGCSAVDES